jgi:DNA-binding response OmpR family regulator
MARPVLVVRHDDRLRAVVRVKLEREGLTVAEATDAEQALIAITTSPAGSVIVVCGSRPGATSAEVFVAAARQADPSVRIFFLTTRAPLLSGLLLSDVEVFPKPHGLNNLCRAVKAAIG